MGNVTRRVSPGDGGTLNSHCGPQWKEAWLQDPALGAGPTKLGFQGSICFSRQIPNCAQHCNLTAPEFLISEPHNTPGSDANQDCAPNLELQKGKCKGFRRWTARVGKSSTEKHEEIKRS